VAGRQALDREPLQAAQDGVDPHRPLHVTALADVVQVVVVGDEQLDGPQPAVGGA